MKAFQLVFATAIAALSLSAAAQAPLERWAVSHYGPGSTEAIIGCGSCASDQRAMAIDASGHVVVTGYATTATASDMLTTRFDGATGAVLWQKTYDAGLGAHEQSWALALDGAGNAIVTGYAYTGSEYDITTIKYAASDGAVLWQKSFTGPASGIDFGIALGVDATGNVFVGGNVWNGANDDLKIIKYAAADGALLWDKTFTGAAGLNDYAFALTVDAAGNAIVTGENQQGATDSDWKTIKYAAIDGAVLWERSFAGTGGGLDIPFSVAVDTAGNAVIAGHSHNGANFDGKVVKYAAADGATIWEKTFAGADAGDDMYYSLALDASGNAIVAGFTFSTAGSNDWNVAKYAAADGALLWRKSVGGSGNLSDVAVTVAVDAQGNAIAGGRINDSADPANRDMHAVKFAASDGAVLWRYTYAGSAGAFDRVASVATAPGVTVLAGESAETGAPAGWRIVKLGDPGGPAPYDFNADGRPDIIWSNIASGATYIWRMFGTTLIADSFLATIDPSWKIQGVADFNGDGHPDVVWRNTLNGNCYVWYLVDGVFQTDAFVFGLPPEWVIQGVADFNADGKPDFLMRNTVSGNAFAWFFDDNVAIGDQFLFSIDPSWKVEGVADLDADGQPDLLFRNMTSGLAFAWNTQFAAGTLSLTTSSPPIFGIDPVWEVVQVADWNADGKPDLLFRNASTGLVFVWYLDGVALGASDYVTQIDPSWEIVPRR
ncbi:MAG: PQQ-binding-like beta-propeller repeat protein [Burkholderiales bacterium]